MKLQIASDLHLEYAPEWELPAGNADVLVLAGDVAIQTHGLAAFRDRARQQPVLYVPGNHEYYCGHFGRTAAVLRARARQWGLFLLDGDAVVLGGVRFLGATLWTDFALFGAADRPAAQRRAQAVIPDYHVISTDDGWLAPERTWALHRAAVAWLRGRLAEPFAGPTVVITHHAPHPGSLHPRFARHPLSPAFVSDLEVLLGPARLWIHGHTHDAFDYVVADTRILCNPRGYDPFALNPAFDPALVVAV